MDSAALARLAVRADPHEAVIYEPRGLKSCVAVEARGFIVFMSLGYPQTTSLELPTGSM